ncbi:hypothetical protein DIPPA_70198a, partial [Diplonema papillatum]
MDGASFFNAEKFLAELKAGDQDAILFVMKYLVFPFIMCNVLLYVIFGGRSKSGGRINTTVEMDKPKVVNKIAVPEAMAKAGKDQLVFCRCWKSKSFPYCD